jgi:hypothetical protein
MNAGSGSSSKNILGTNQMYMKSFEARSTRPAKLNMESSPNATPI